MSTAAPIRVGNGDDGGYVMPVQTLDRARSLISMGLESDWTFEEFFLERARGSVICFDHTVTPRFWLMFTAKALARGRWRTLPRYLGYRRFFAQSRAEHRKLKIGYDSDGSVSLDTILDERGPAGGDILLKIDIEGWEYRILDQIVANQDYFCGIVMEFHDLDLHRDRVDRFLHRLDQFEVTWLHGNNYGGTDNEGDPIVVEMTLARRGLLASDTAAEDSARMTCPNNPDLPEVELRFEPT